MSVTYRRNVIKPWTIIEWKDTDLSGQEWTTVPRISSLCDERRKIYPAVDFRK